MITMKRLSRIACVCAFLIAMCAQAYAQDGSTCYRAIPLGDDYHANISGAKTVWYTAWTYDLPLSVYFIPTNPSDPEPEVTMDFGCTPGIYADPIICLLFCQGGTSSMPMPHSPKLSTTTIDGQFAYYLTMGKTYRDLLLKMGIDYNVQVFVKVKYKSSGSMSIAPDNMFSSCMDGAKFMHFGDTIRVQTATADRHVVVPYVQWQNDSILYKWQGTEPCRLLVASDCRFNVQDDGSDENILDIIDLQPGEAYKVPSCSIKHYVGFVDNEAGMFFAKCYTTGSGVLTVEQVPMDPPNGDAVLLYYDKNQVLMANDTNALYAISQDWNVATRFFVPTNHIFRMYIGKTPGFTPATADTSFTFSRTIDGHELILDENTMKGLWYKKAASENYLYVRFACTARTTLLASQWEASPCVAAVPLIKKNSTIRVNNMNYGTNMFRFRYLDWEGGDMIFTSQNRGAGCVVAVGDTCLFDAAVSDPLPPHVIYSFTALRRTTSATRPYTVPAETVAQWRQYIDEDGYLYLRFNSGTSAGDMDITSTAPEETDPVYPASTVAIECVDGNPGNLSVSVSADQHLTVIDAVGTTVSEWDAVVGTPHSVSLSAGLYTLVGTDENLTIQVP